MPSNRASQKFIYIYTGPSSWNKEDGHARNTRSGNAKLAEMHDVTARSLAYVATLTRFALSSSDTNQKIGGQFDMTQFFWHVVQFLEDEDFEDDVRELLTWWTSRIFPSEKNSTPPDAPVVDSLALLKAQKAAKRAALGNATNKVPSAVPV